MDETKIIAGAVSRIIGQVDLEALKKIFKAEKNAHQASISLGNNAQWHAQNVANKVCLEAIEALPPYSIARIKNEFKLAARELEDLTNG